MGCDDHSIAVVLKWLPQALTGRLTRTAIGMPSASSLVPLIGNGNVKLQAVSNFAIPVTNPE